MTQSGNMLSFRTVDDIALAITRRTIYPNDLTCHEIKNVGPWIEYYHLLKSGGGYSAFGDNWIDFARHQPLIDELKGQRDSWFCHKTNSKGFIRTTLAENNEDAGMDFDYRARQAAVDVRFPSELASRLVAALVELRSNTFEHSNASDTGVCVYNAKEGAFEFVVADCGIGVLDSLRTSSQFSELFDHGTALKLFVQDGVSRFGVRSGRGHGFRPIFVGLANARCELRFRSGDYAYEIDGTQLSEKPAQISQCTYLQGLVCSVTCYWS